MLRRLKSTKSVLFTFDDEPGLVQTADFAGEKSVLDVALANGVPLNHSCGGMASCSTCRVFVIESPEPLTERGELESEIAGDRGFKDNERLACQLEAQDGLRVKVPHST